MEQPKPIETERPIVIINLGARVCEALKISYFKEKHWSQCWKEVGSMFTAVKRQARKFYVDLTEKEMLRELCKYKPEDFKDLL